MKRVPFVTIMLAVLLTACAQATPTTDPAQIQASAVAAANTMVALTQAAVPTETPVPPTPIPSPTPLPSPTVQALPTLALTTVPTQAPKGGGNTGGNTSGDPCQAPLPSKPAGPLVTVRVINSTKGSIVFSLWLTAKTPFGECGYKGGSMSSGGSVSVTVPEGCYGAGAFVDAPKQHKAFGSGCFKSTANGTVTIDSTDVIKFQQ